MNIRKSSRTKVLRTVQLYVEASGYRQAVVKDYSSFGLCIRSEFDAFVGETLLVKFPSGELKKGVVRWVATPKFGIEMDLPLSTVDFLPPQEEANDTFQAFARAASL